MYRRRTPPNVIITTAAEHVFATIRSAEWRLLQRDTKRAPIKQTATIQITCIAAHLKLLPTLAVAAAGGTGSETATLG